MNFKKSKDKNDRVYIMWYSNTGIIPGYVTIRIMEEDFYTTYNYGFRYGLVEDDLSDEYKFYSIPRSDIVNIKSNHELKLENAKEEIFNNEMFKRLIKLYIYIMEECKGTSRKFDVFRRINLLNEMLKDLDLNHQKIKQLLLKNKYVCMDTANVIIDYIGKPALSDLKKIIYWV